MNIEFTINIKHALLAVLRQWVAILAVGVAAFMVASIVTFYPQPDGYQAKSTVYATAGGASQNTGAVDDVMKSLSIVRSYSQVATSMKVLNQAALVLNMPEVTGKVLSAYVRAQIDEQTSLVVLTVTSTSPTFAVAAVNAVAEAFVGEIRTITGENNVTVLDVADEAVVVSNGVMRQWTIRLVAMVAAMALMVAAILLKDILSNRITSLHAASLKGQLDIIGVIPAFPGEKKRVR